MPAFHFARLTPLSLFPISPYIKMVNIKNLFCTFLCPEDITAVLPLRNYDEFEIFICKRHSVRVRRKWGHNMLPHRGSRWVFSFHLHLLRLPQFASHGPERSSSSNKAAHYRLRTDDKKKMTNRGRRATLTDCRVGPAVCRTPSECRRVAGRTDCPASWRAASARSAVVRRRWRCRRWRRRSTWASRRWPVRGRGRPTDRHRPGSPPSHAAAAAASHRVPLIDDRALAAATCTIL